MLCVYYDVGDWSFLIEISSVCVNGPSPLLVDIVLFRLLLKTFKTRPLGRGFCTFIKGVSFSYTIDVGHYRLDPTWVGTKHLSLYLLGSFGVTVSMLRTKVGLNFCELS